MSTSSKLVLFSELPLHSKFRFEKPNEGEVWVKTTEGGAHNDGGFAPVNPGVLVFPVPNKINAVNVVLDNASRFVALRLVSGKWLLTDSVSNTPLNTFDSLDDVLSYLGT